MHEAEKIKLITATLLAGHCLEKLSRLSRMLSYKTFMNIYGKNITGLTASIMCFDTDDYTTMVKLYSEFKNSYDFYLPICKSRLLEAKEAILNDENNTFDAETVAIAKEINFE